MRKFEDRIESILSALPPQQEAVLREALGKSGEHSASPDSVPEANLLYSDIFRNIQIGLHIYRLEDPSDDTSLRMIMINDAGEKIIGLPSEKLIGKTIDENFPGLRDMGIPRKYAQVILSGQQEDLGEVCYGDRRLAKKIYSVKAFPLGNCCLGVAFEDITENIKTKEQLQQTSAILQAAMDNSTAGIAIADAPDGKLLYVNDAGLFIRGDTDHEVVKDIGVDKYVASWNILDLDGTPLKADEVPLARAVLYGENCTREFIIRRDNTEDRLVLGNAAPIRDSDGSVQAGIVVFQDITELRQLERKLFRRHQALSLFREIATVRFSSDDKLFEYLLEKIVELTESRFGFFGLMNGKENTMIIHSWSGEAMEGCSMVDQPSHFPIDEAGVWAEAVRNRTVFRMNTYSGEHPAKHGIPTGHVPIENLMVVPVISDDSVVAVAAVANRMSDYSEELADITETLCRNIWYFIERRQVEEHVREALEKSDRRNKELEALLAGANTILGIDTFEDAARKLFDSARKMTGAQSGYVALLREDGQENEVLFLESGGLPCFVDESLPMPVRGLRGDAYRDRKTVFHNDFMNSEWVKFMPEGHVMLRNVMFAPLNIEDRTVGIMGLANKDGDFTDEDARLASAFGQLAALSLKNSRNLDKLQEARDFSKNLVDTAPAIILIIDNDGRIIQFNQYMEELSGYKADEVKGKNWFSLFLPEDIREETCDYFKKIGFAENEKGGGYVNPFVTRSGEQRIIEWYNKPIYNAAGTSTGCLAVGIDITDRMVMQKRLQQSEKMEAIGQLAGGIAHDFNNILGGIIGYADMSLDKIPKGSRVEAYLERILKSADRAKDLVKEILAFSRHSPEEKLPVHLDPIVKEVAQLLRASLPSTIQISTSLSAESHPVLATPAKIHEILMNLCTNAAHAMDEKGVLEVAYTEEKVERELSGFIGSIEPGVYAVIRVKDTGSGIPQDILCHIFEPFFTTKPVGIGTGMGLAVVFGIVQTHKGNIIVDTEPGKGTEFNIYLPITDELPEDDETSLEEIPSGKERILFVDDEEVLCDMINDMLEMLGYTVTTCSDSMTALTAFKNAPEDFDMLITDQTMPTMTGIELAGEVLQIRKDIPVVLCTGYSRTVDEKTCREAGIRAFCMKPLRKNEIAIKIREILDSSPTPAVN